MALRANTEGVGAWEEFWGPPAAKWSGLSELRDEKNVPLDYTSRWAHLLRQCPVRGWIDFGALAGARCQLDDLGMAQGEPNASKHSDAEVSTLLSASCSCRCTACCCRWRW